MIEVDGLTKYYGEHPAIRDLTFSIERGEVIGFLGLNGAGKTTALKVLGCVLIPTSGRVVIDGIDIAQDPHSVRQRIGFLPDLPPLYPEMTVSAFLRFAAELRGVPARRAPGLVEEAESKTGTREVHDELIAHLSHGYRQRVGVAQALVHRPALLVLDEPTAGLDPAQIVEMRSLIRALRGEHTVLLSSHILSEISQTCDRLLVIQAGEIVAQGTEADLAARIESSGAGPYRESVSSWVEVEVRAPAARALEILRALPGVAAARVHGEDAIGATIRVDAPADLRPAIARALIQGGVELLRLDRASAKLESIFLQLTRGQQGQLPASVQGGNGKEPSS